MHQQYLLATWGTNIRTPSFLGAAILSVRLIDFLPHKKGSAPTRPKIKRSMELRFMYARTIPFHTLPYPPISSISSFKAWPLCSVTSRAAIRSLTSASSFEQPPCPCPPSSEASQQSWKAGGAASMSEVGDMASYAFRIEYMPRSSKARPESTRNRKTWKAPPISKIILSKTICTHQDEDG